jgi:hypothetical protein
MVAKRKPHSRRYFTGYLQISRVCWVKTKKQRLKIRDVFTQRYWKVCWSNQYNSQEGLHFHFLQVDTLIAISEEKKTLSPCAHFHIALVFCQYQLSALGPWRCGQLVSGEEHCMESRPKTGHSSTAVISCTSKKYVFSACITITVKINSISHLFNLFSFPC